LKGNLILTDAEKKPIRRHRDPSPKWQPGQPFPSSCDRRTAAAIVTAEVFPVSYRSIERWPLPVRRVNGRALVNVAEVLGYAENLLKRSRPYMPNDARTARMGGA
jgi:hypothetical protein